MATLNPIQTVGQLPKFTTASAGAPASGPFTTTSATPPANVGNETRRPVTPTVTGPYDSLRAPLGAANPGIPQSYVDKFIDDENRDNATNGGVLTDSANPTPQAVAAASDKLQRLWASEPPAKQAQFQQADAGVIAGDNTSAIQNWGAQQVGTIPGKETDFANNAFGTYVQPQITALNNANAKQIAANNQEISDVNGIVGNYGTTLDQQEALRMAGINDTTAKNSAIAQQVVDDARSTNAYQTGLANEFSGDTATANSSLANYQQQLEQATQATNANQTAALNTVTGQFNQLNSDQLAALGQITGQANAINANQTQLYNTLAGQASAANAQQNQLFSTLSGQAQSTNDLQTAALNKFLGDVSQANDDQSFYNQAFQDTLRGLTGSTQQYYDQYMKATDPLMEIRQAQGSDPADVAAMQDVQQRFKDISTPQVTDQERLLAELARRKFESDDAASRAAIQQQLATRGLNSGGQAIAMNQATQQQLSQDRLLSELGLNANAVQRAEFGLTGYDNASNALRAANDAERNFQDVYAQNEAQRVGNLGNQRYTAGLNEVGTEANLANLGFGAGTTTVNNNFARNQAGYNATSQTNNDNYARDQSVFNAGTTTVNNNFARNQSVFNAGTTTNEDNFARDQNVFQDATTSYNNIGNRDQMAFNDTTTTNTDNFNRTSGTIKSGQDTAETILGNQGVDITNRSNTSANNFNRLDGPGGALDRQQTTNTANNTLQQGGINSGEQALNSKTNLQLGAAQLPSTLAAGQVSSAQGNLQTGVNLAGSITGTQGTIDAATAAAIEKLTGAKVGKSTLNYATGQN